MPHDKSRRQHSDQGNLQIDIGADRLGTTLDPRSLEHPEYTAFITGPSRCAATILYLPNGRVHMLAHPRANGTYVVHVIQEFRSIQDAGKLCSGGSCSSDCASANMSAVVASVALNYTGREIMQITFSHLSQETEGKSRQSQPFASNAGCWRPSSNFANLILPAKHAGLEWLWQPDHLHVPIFKTAPQMRAALKQTGDILFIGDSLMRTTFQAFVDVALDYQFPYHGIREKWCGLNRTQFFDGLGALTIAGDGCWSGNGTFSLFLEEKNVTLSYLPIFNAGQTTIDALVDAGLLEKYRHVFINYGLHDISMYSKDRFQTLLQSRLERLSASRARMQTPCKITYLGLWAQRLSKKPIDWIWSGSHKRTEAFLDVMRTTAVQNGIPFIDTYAMTLPMLEYNVDGVHFDEHVTRDRKSVV